MLNINETHENIADTKMRILVVANTLFARQGFDGVSVRDIANQADVNVAAINYHFTNKLGLLHEIFNYNYEWLDEQISLMAQDHKTNTAEISVKIFRLFRENGPALVNSFKMILTDHLCPDVEALKELSRAEPLGPPGNKAILDVITREVGEEVSFERRDWAMRMIFINIVHSSICLNSNYFKNRCSEEIWMKDPNLKEEEFRELARSLIDRIKANPGKLA